MEIWNTGCAQDNGMDTNAAYWDELLGQGQRAYTAWQPTTATIWGSTALATLWSMRPTP